MIYPPNNPSNNMIMTLDKIKGWNDERELMDNTCHIVIALGGLLGQPKIKLVIIG